MSKEENKETPKLTNEKLLAIVKEVEGTDNVELVTSNTKSATSAGENYSSTVLCIDIEAKVNGDTKEYHWIAKIPPSDPARIPFNRGLKMEEKEISFYKELIPALKNYIKEKGVDIDLNFPNCWYTEFHEDPLKGSIIIMDNMVSRGYTDAVEKKKGLGLDYACMAIAELARLHAASYAYFKSHPGGFSEAIQKHRLVSTDYAFGEPSEDFKKIISNFDVQGKNAAKDLIEAVQEPGQDLLGAFERWTTEVNPTDLQTELFACKFDTFKVLCHGDPWFNNMLFE